MKAIIAILYLTGARISEILAMTPRCVNDLETEVKLRIMSLKRRKEKYVLRCNKCGTSYKVRRRFAITPSPNLKCKVCASKDYAISQKTPKSSAIADRILTVKKDAPFLNFVLDFSIDCTMGEGLDAKMFRVSRQLVGYYLWKHSKTVSPHCFRHSRLQKLADKGATARQIQSFAGHASVSSSDPYIESSEALISPTKEMID